MDRLLTNEDLAERVRRPLNTVRYWRYQGTGPKGANIGGRVMYRESDVEAWIEDHFAKAEGAGPDAA